MTSEEVTLDFLDNGRISRRQSLGFLVQGQSSKSKSKQSQYIKEIPDVIRDVRNGLRASVALCQRNSKQMGLGKNMMEKRGLSPLENRGAEHQAQMLDIWFTLLEVLSFTHISIILIAKKSTSVLAVQIEFKNLVSAQVFVARIRHVSQQAPGRDLETKLSTITDHTPQNIPMSCRLLHSLTHYDLRSTDGTGNSRNDSSTFSLLHEVYSVFMQEIVTAMAGI